MNAENQVHNRKTGINIQLIIILVLAVLLVIFTLQNQEKVSLKLFFWTVSNIPVALLIIICMLVGYLIPTMLLIPRIWKLKSKLRRAQEEEEEPEEENQETKLEKQKPDPEGIAFEDEEEQNTVDLARKNVSRRFFKE
jgi:lipopolysaccharide assembly protein A